VECEQPDPGITRGLRFVPQGKVRWIFRRAAELALIGWYLMVPPSTPKGLTNPKAALIKGSAPISGWVIRKEDSIRLEGCEEGKVAGMNKARPIAQDNEEWKKRRMHDPYSALSLVVQMLVAQCVATDDPRLKGE
jgi:hypothetical protein